MFFIGKETKKWMALQCVFYRMLTSSRYTTSGRPRYSIFHHRSEQHQTGGESFQGVSGRIREPLPQRKKTALPESEEKFDWDNIYNNRMSEEQELSLRTHFTIILPQFILQDIFSLLSLIIFYSLE